MSKQRAPPERHGGTVTATEKFIKRSFDVCVAAIALIVLGWLIAIAVLAARIEIGRSGIFRQLRIGRNGALFFLYKIRTMRDFEGYTTSITTDGDPRITRLGRLLRRWKIDELPQLVNVLRGEMSLVGPRPDVPTYLPTLRRDAPLVLAVQPGITGPATLKYRFEEQLLASQADPEQYNDRVIFPDKMRINVEYVRNFSLANDFKYLLQTFWPRRRIATGENATKVRR